MQQKYWMSGAETHEGEALGRDELVGELVDPGQAVEVPSDGHIHFRREVRHLPYRDGEPLVVGNGQAARALRHEESPAGEGEVPRPGIGHRPSLRSSTALRWHEGQPTHTRWRTYETSPLGRMGRRSKGMLHSRVS